MTTNYEALDQLTKVNKKMRKFAQANQPVLEKWEQLQNERNEAESAVKAEARKLQMNYHNKEFKVTYSPAFRKWYDVTVALKKATPKVRDFINAHCIKQEINKEAFEDAVEQGEIPVEIKQEAYREAPTTARILIKENHDED